MSGPDALDPTEHRRIYEELIARDAEVVRATAQEAPRAIILAGQPGAGKGGLARVAQGELDGNVVVVDPDALRRFHPSADVFRSETPYSWSGRTHADASKWADQLLEDVVAGRRNLIFDTTMSNGPWAAELINDLKRKGYAVEVRAIATPKLESELGVDNRFSAQVDRAGYGRHVPQQAQDAIFEKFPRSLDVVRTATDAPIRIFDRDGRELYDSRTDQRLPRFALGEALETRLHEPAIARQLQEKWEAQRAWHHDLPSTLAENPRVDAGTAQRMLAERNGLDVQEAVERNTRAAASNHTLVQEMVGLDAERMTRAAAHEASMARAPQLRAGSALGFAGLALSAYDAADTGFRIRRHLDAGNATAAQSEAIHFGGRSVGGFAGAGLGAATGAALGVETGPGLLVTGAVGGVVGAVAGDKLAAWVDNHSIYNQTDRQGNQWTLDPKRQDRGWRRLAPVDGTQDGIDNARREPLRASPLLESELNFQATRHSAELVLGSPPVPRDPFHQPATASDTPSVVEAPWVRTSNGTWERTATLAHAERGLAPTRTEAATPERAAQLDQAAARTIVQNTENIAPVIAARFEDAYVSQGWARFWPMPDAVSNARTNVDALVASDGDTYSRQPDGRWVSQGMVMDSNATGNLREELDASRSLLISRLPPPQQIATPLPLSADERLRDTIVGAYRNAGLELSGPQLEERAKAVRETWRTHGLSADTTALRVAASNGYVGVNSPIESLRLDADGRTYRRAATTAMGVDEPELSATRSQSVLQRGSPALSRREHQEPDGDENARRRPRLANDPTHPDHATFDRIHTWVRGTGQWDDERSLNVAAALYGEQVKDPLIQRVDRVVGGLGRDGSQNAFAVYAPHGDKEPTFHVHVDGRVASQQPAQQTLQHAEQFSQQRVQEQSLQQEQHQARTAPVLAR